jgi:SpoVK/Ycf46/Vps4 family AAA+-type ATPase
MNELDELEKRKLVRCCRDTRFVTYRITRDVIECLKQGKEYFPVKHQNISINELFTELEELFDQKKENELTFATLVFELETLMDDNMQLEFCKKIKNCPLGEEDKTLLLFFCHLFVNDDDDGVGFHDFDDLFANKSTFKRIKSAFKERYNDLITDAYIENTNSNGFEDREYFKLTDKTKKELLAELNIRETQAKSVKGMILSNSITQKELFYNDKEADQIQRLTALLQKDNFLTVQKRLSDSGMRTGFACLFYGAPGTGKTETVYQLARETGRNIMMVDIAETKSMWFGESEKKIKEIFDRYKSLVKSSETAPILLFNEADAVIGKRMEATDRSVDKTMNAIQNIILQEMENLDGIMIATTNLTQTLDKAFERRFLYKIEFEKPNLVAKQAIWQVMIPTLSDTDANVLALRYDFSGGQIENIARKRTVDTIISGNESSLDDLLTYCQNELMAKQTTRNKVGF